MEITSLGLLLNGTRDLETEGGRTSSRATGPETERASATTDSWSIARVAPAATAGCGSTGKPGTALGERADDDAYQSARCHRPAGASPACAAQTDPAVNPVSLLPQNATAGQVNVVQSAGQGETGSVGATQTVVNVVQSAGQGETGSVGATQTVVNVVQSAGQGETGSVGATQTVVKVVTSCPRRLPASVSNILLTVLLPPLPLSSCQRRSRPGRVQPRALPRSNRGPRPMIRGNPNSRLKECSNCPRCHGRTKWRLPAPSSRANLDHLQDSGGVRHRVLEGDYQPARSTGGASDPALDQLYLVGPSGVILTMLKGAAAYARGPRQDMMILLTQFPTTPSCWSASSKPLRRPWRLVLRKHHHRLPA